MTARTHDLAAVTALGIVFLSEPTRVLTLSTIIASVIANLIGGIAPDIDQPTAPFWRNLPIGKFFGKTFDKLIGGHRFFTHSLIGIAVFVFAAHWLLVFFHPVMKNIDIGIVTWAFSIGMLSHLVMDSFTKEGVPWLLPIPVRFGFPPLKSLRITTGKSIENFVIFPGLLVFNIWMYYANYHELLKIIHRQIT